MKLAIDLPEDRLPLPIGQVLLNLPLMLLQGRFQMDPYLLILIQALAMIVSMIRALCRTRVILLTPAVLSW